MKLKALTLVGFKSFADKTTFEFHDGVTCIVGPNGCGKSNVVDAFKWVLGEQSAKSLRGGEMLDVVFNGTSQRRSSGYAQVSLTFEDAAGVLGQSTDDDPARTVVISRRLYRSGESEYMINKKPARLKDIREMFLDTGVGVDAYSLIEQGKVEIFLQSSPDARRAVFDEAAGISRYKARRREASRKLERVEQNLLRLVDVLGEVQKRLRSIKYQAGKARSYQKHSTRLGELRSLFAQAEYHRLHNRRREVQAEADAINDALAGLNAQIDRLQVAESAAGAELADLERSAHEIDGKIMAISGDATAATQRSEMLGARARELADEITSDVARCEKLEARIEANSQDSDAQQQMITQLEAELERLADRHESLAGQYTTEQGSARGLANQLEDEKDGTIELLRRTAQLHNEINTQTMRRESLHAQREKLSGRGEQIAQALEEMIAQRRGMQAKVSQASGVIAESKARLVEAQQRGGELASSVERVGLQLSQAEQDRSALIARQNVLEEMQRRFEGVGEGARRVLTAVREGRVSFIRGMLGDFIEADVSRAGVIEAALGGAEQRLVADRLEDVLAARGELREMLADTDGAAVIWR